MEEDYKQQREALLVRLARAEQSYKETMERAAKADALEKECERMPSCSVCLKAVNSTIWILVITSRIS